MKRKIPKRRRGSSWNKDGAGKPMFRSKLWGERDDKDPRKDRRNWRKDIDNGKTSD